MQFLVWACGDLAYGLARKFETQIIGCGQESFLEMNLLLSRLLFLELLGRICSERE